MGIMYSMSKIYKMDLRIIVVHVTDHNWFTVNFQSIISIALILMGDIDSQDVWALPLDIFPCATIDILCHGQIIHNKSDVIISPLSQDNLWPIFYSGNV